MLEITAIAEVLGVSSMTFITVMQTANLPVRDYRALLRCLDSARLRRVLSERHVRTGAVIMVQK